MDDYSVPSHGFPVKKIKKRVETLFLSEAIDLCMSGEHIALIDIENRCVLATSSFKDWLPKKSKITLADLHSLILPFYDIIVKAYCRSAREILTDSTDLRMKGTYVQMLFPSTVKLGSDNTIICINSRPIIIKDEKGERFGALNSFEIMGIHNHDYFPIMPFIKRGKAEMIMESDLVVQKAAPFIFKKIKMLTDREWDIVQYLNDGFSESEISTLMNIRLWTVKTHRSNLTEKIKRSLPTLNDRMFGRKMQKMKVI